jgi:siroheme synthase (precorrin-2 oxidase/ferrochelatase)
LATIFIKIKKRKWLMLEPPITTKSSWSSCCMYMCPEKRARRRFWERFFSSCYSTNKCYTNLTTKLQKETKENKRKN